MAGILGYLLDGVGHAIRALPFAAGPYLVALLVVVAAYAPGRSLAGALAGISPLERWVLSTGLGLVAVGTAAFALGLVGWFTRTGVAATLVLLQLPLLGARVRAHRAGASARIWARIWARIRARIRPRIGRPSRGAIVAVAGLAALVLLVGTLALYPLLGFDSTLYHLPMAQALVDGHRLPFLPDLRAPVFPQLSEALFAVAMVFGDDRAARLLELAQTALVAVAIFGWTRRRGSTRAGLWAAALWLGSPFVLLYGSDAYVDATVALFATLALVALDARGDERDERRPWLAGVFAGAAAATKYLGLFYLAAVPLGCWVAGRSRRRWRTAIFALVAAVAVAAPWYARIAYHTGNPVFPFFPQVFGANDWTPFVGLGPASRLGAGGAEGVVGAVGSALRSVAVGASGKWYTWTGPPAFDPWLWVLAPAALLLARRPRPPLAPLLVALAYAPAVWLLAPEARYLLPALPWAAAAVALGLDRLLPRAASASAGLHRLAVALAVVVLVAPGAAYVAYRIARQGPVPRTEADREAFLATRRPGYAAILDLNRRLGSDYTLYNLGGEELRYFVAGRYLGDQSGPARFADVIAASRRGPDALAAKLRDLDAGFLLVVLDPAGSRFRELAPGPSFEPVYRDAGSRLYAVPEGLSAAPATTP